MMQLRHLRYLVATVDAGSVNAAAAVVHVTQPALSRQLRQLEHDLGAELFERSAGRLSLNRTGRALLPAVRELLAAADALRDRAAFHARGGMERVVIAAPTVTLTDVVSPFVATMAPDDPVVDVRAADGLATADALGAGADLAIGTRRPPADYAWLPLAVLPVWAHVPDSDPWAARERVLLEELIERPLVVLPSTHTAREALDLAVAAAGASFSSRVEAGNGTIAQALAAAGRGVAVVSDDPRYELRPLAVELDDGVLSIRLVAAWDPRAVTAGTIEGLVVRLRDWVARQYGGGAAVQRSWT
jgi:DNA-binding transcriptional LysR family regulator